MRRKLLLMLCGAVTATSAVAADFSKRNDNDDWVYYNITSESTVEVASGAVSDAYTCLLIPDDVTYNGTTYTVTGIADDALRGQSRMTTVELGANIASIGENPFANCPLLNEISIAGSNPNFAVESGLLYNAAKTTLIAYPPYINVIDLPATVTAFGDYSINDYSYNDWAKKKSMTIPATVKTIGTKAFCHCPNLTSLTVLEANPANITLGADAFYGIDKSTCSLTVPYGSLALYQAADQWKDFYSITEAEPEYTTVGLKYTLNSDNASYSVSGTTSALPADVIIPREYNGLPVTAIAANCFENKSALKSVIIPNTVTSIGKTAFFWCTGLAEFTIPNSVTSIGDQAFGSCTKLAEITIPSSVTSIGSYAFSNCSALRTVTFENGTEELIIDPLDTANDPHVFTNETLTTLFVGRNFNYKSTYSPFSGLAIKNLTIGKNVTHIGKSEFKGCSRVKKLIFEDGEETLVIGDPSSGSVYYSFESVNPDTVYLGREIYASISDQPFYKKNKIKSATISEKLTSIVDYTFCDCTGLTEITIPASVTSIGREAFCNTKLTEITIPENVVNIGDGAFLSCTELTEITIPNLVETIGEAAFMGCSKIAGDLVIPDATITIGTKAFYNCSALTSLSLGNSVETIGESAFEGCSNIACDLVIPDATITIGTKAFRNITGLTSLTLGNSVETIGESAFEGCSNIAGNQVIPDATTTIGTKAFYNCTALTSLTLGNSVETIGESAFEGCSNIAGNQVIPDATITIGTKAFYNCKALTSLTLGDSVETIGESAFEGCSNIACDLDIPDATITIGTKAFNNLTGLTSLTIGNSVVTVGDYAFNGCANIVADIVVPNTTTTIGNYSFNNCYGLTSLTLGESLETIGNYAFYCCNNISNALIVPESTKTIGQYAFSGCNRIPKAKIGSDVTTLGNYAFQNCTGLEEVAIDGDITSIGTNTFSGCKTTFLFKSVVPHTYAYQSCPCVVPGVALTDYKTAWPSHKDEILSSEVPYKYEVNVTASPIQSDLVEKINAMALLYNADLIDALLNVVELKVIGSINSYDVMALHNKMLNLQRLDLSEADVVANSYQYYTGYCTKDNVITERFLGEMKNLLTVKLPNSATTIEQYAAKSDRTIVLNKVIIGSGTKTINAYAFQSQKTIKEVILGESVESIGNYAFAESGIQSIYIVPSVKTMGTYVLASCPLNKITISDDARVNIGANAFSNCTSLTEFNSGNSTVSIGGTAFNKCTALKSVILGSTHAYDEANPTLTLGASLFSGCTALAEVTIGNNVPTIPTSLFSQCKALATVIIGEGTKTISEQAFYQCTALTNLTLGSRVENIGNKSFQGCTSLKEFVVPRGVKIISDYAFSGCTKLNNVTFSPGLKKIKTYAFSGCTSLQKAMLPTSLETIGTYAFNGCTALRELKIPSSIRTIGDYAFQAANIKDVYTWTIQPTDINQNTFHSNLDTGATIHVPATANRLYFYDTKWSKFIHMTNFDEPYEYFYLTNRDLIVDEETVRLKGNPEAELGVGSGLLIAGNDPQALGDVHLLSNGTHSAAIIGAAGSGDGGANLNIDNLTVEIEITKNKWYFFCFPFDLTFDDMEFPGQYVWRWYDGSVRAEQGSGKGAWKNAVGSITAGQGYIFQGSANGVLKLHVGKLNVGGEDEVKTELITYQANNINDASWNLIGNPFASYYELCDMDYDSPVTYWDPNTNNYKAVHPDDDEFTLRPFQAYFVQKPRTLEYIEYDPYCQETKNQSEDPNFRRNAKMRRAKRRAPAAERFVINVEIGTDSIIDRTRVVFNSESTFDYELGTDASKFFTESSVQIYTIGFDNSTEYAINERPMSDGTVKLGFYAPTGGTYTFSTSRQDIEMEIYDVKTGKAALLSEGYTFSAGKGTDNDRFILRLPTDPAGIDAVNGDIDGYDDAEYYGVDGIQYDKNHRGVTIQRGSKGVRKVYNR